MTSVNRGSLFLALIPQKGLGQSLFHRLPLGCEIIWEEVLGPRHSQASCLFVEKHYHVVCAVPVSVHISELFIDWLSCT